MTPSGKKLQPIMKKIIYTKIVGDIFHPGHIKFLKKAREQGDKLVVHVVSDERVMAYKRKPILSQSERAEVVASCRYVDEVILDGPKEITIAYMTSKGYTHYAYGFSDEVEAKVKRQDCSELSDDQIFIIPYSKGISTTELIHRIKSSL